MGMETPTATGTEPKPPPQQQPAAPNEIRIGPQPGPQTMFHASRADIAIYGGQAGGGKSFSIVAEPLRHAPTNGDFGAVIFRRTTPEIRKSGGLYEQARKLYRQFKARWTTSPSIEFYFPSGGRISMSHLEREDSVYAHAGAQYAYIGFDELTMFSREMFFFMLSRNRTMCGIKPYIRATCNPDADSWVAAFISWWICEETGYPITEKYWDVVAPKYKGIERSGVLRWFVRRGDDIVWADTREALIEKFGPKELPKSVTFISARLEDNQILMQANPDYESNLNALNAVDRARLRGGNWKVRASAGLLFKRAWCKTVDVAPVGLEWVRYWDLAATEKTESNDPDWTVGVKLGRRQVGSGYEYFIGHVERAQESPKGVRRTLKNTAQADSGDVRIGIPQDPAQAGKDQAEDIVRELSGYDCRSRIESGDKVTRFGPFSAQCEAGNVTIVKGTWNEAYLSALEAFPDGKHKDDADASSGAFRMFQSEETGFLEFMRMQHDQMNKQISSADRQRRAV